MVRRGDVRWYRFARPDKRRPVLVLTRDSIIPRHCTPSEVPLSPDDGMPRPGAVNCDHLQTVQRGKLGAVITTMPTSTMAQVAPAIRFALALCALALWFSRPIVDPADLLDMLDIY